MLKHLNWGPPFRVISHCRFWQYWPFRIDIAQKQLTKVAAVQGADPKHLPPIILNNSSSFIILIWGGIAMQTMCLAFQWMCLYFRTLGFPSGVSELDYTFYVSFRLCCSCKDLTLRKVTALWQLELFIMYSKIYDNLSLPTEKIWIKFYRKAIPQLTSYKRGGLTTYFQLVLGVTF